MIDWQHRWLILALRRTTLLGFVAGWLVRGYGFPSTSTAPQWLHVTGVLVGDTLELSTGERGPLIGVDTLELHGPRQLIGAAGHAALALTEQLVEGKPVRLECGARRWDPNQRLLASVSVGDVMLNAELCDMAMRRWPASRPI